MDKKEKTRRLNVLIPEETHHKLKAIARRQGTTISALVRTAIQQEIAWQAREELEMAVDQLEALYASDGELIAFTALDSEDFLEKLPGALEGGPSLTEDLLRDRARDKKKEEDKIKYGADDD